jgi:hypothetical protein
MRQSPSLLSAEKLAQDFGIRTPLTKECLARLYEMIARDEGAYSRWQPIFSQLWGPAESRLREPLLVLMRKICIADNGHPLKFLFALQTHYALLLSLVVKRFEILRNYEIIDPAFAWCFKAECPKLQLAIRRIAEKMEGYDLSAPCSSMRDAIDFDESQNSPNASDLLKDLHHSLFPRAIRHHLGEYYTPDWLAEHLLDQLEFDGRTPGRLLDPACGSGTFLMAAIRRIRRENAQTSVAFRSAKEHNFRGAKGDLPIAMNGEPPCPALPSLALILKSVVGIDLNPLAVMSARANYLIAIHDLLQPNDPLLEIPVHQGDSILSKKGELESEFDYIAGNPPWIAWDNLPGDYREATKPLWKKYGLFSLSASAARHGGGKKDLSMLMLYAAADRYLKPGGRLGFVITQTLFQTKGAGDGFRRFRLGETGDPLKVLRVDDLTAIKPFEDAANWTSTIVLQKGAATSYPVPYVQWKVGQVSNLSAVDQNQPIAVQSNGQVENLSYEKIACTASPIDPRRPTSPWLIQPAGQHGGGHRLVAVSPADYRGYLGANSGGANGVYWVEILEAAEGGVRIRNVVEKSKKPIEQVEQIIEPDLLYPLVRWSDLARYSPLPRYHLLLVQDCQRRAGIEESLLQNRFPLTYAYLRQFETLLTSRAAYRRYQHGQPFYSMYNVGPYTTADFKVVWRRMDKRMNAAVVEPADHPFVGRRAVVPQETCVLIACNSSAESHYLCALLNSEAAGRLLDSHSVRRGKGFGTPSILDYLPLRKHDPDNPLHQELSACSREAHRTRRENKNQAIEDLQAKIDWLAEEAFSA